MQVIWEHTVRDLTNYGLMRLWQSSIAHLEVTAITFVICMLIGVPVGIICAKKRVFGNIVLSVSNFMKVIPSLGVMLILLPYLGAGKQTAVVVLTILGLPPILVNTCLGIRHVDALQIEAAAGMGLTPRQCLFKVEIPLALPMILTGLRTSCVLIVACATLAFYVGGGGMGAAISYGLRMNLIPLLIVSSLIVAAMTAVLDLMFALIQKKVDARYTV